MNSLKSFFDFDQFLTQERGTSKILAFSILGIGFLYMLYKIEN
jgi:hypothetical protein